MIDYTSLDKELTTLNSSHGQVKAKAEMEMDVLTKRIPSQLLIELLDRESVIALCQVNRQWRAKNNPQDRVSALVVSVLLRRVTAGELSRLREKFSDEEFPLLKIHHFNFISSRYQNPSLQELAQLAPRLKILRIFNKEVQNAEEELSLKLFSGLTSLKISCLRYDLLHIGELTSLETLEISSGNMLTDDSLQRFSSLSCLRSLWLEDMVQITDAGLRNLSGLTTLESLSFKACLQITDAGLQHFSHCSALSDLRLSHCDQMGRRNNLPSLRHFTLLRELKINSPYWINNLTENLSGISTLNKLDFSYCEGMEDDLLGLKQCTALQELNFYRCFLITDSDVENLSSLTAIRTLDFDYCKITGKGLQCLSGLTALQTLNLSNCEQITDEGLQGLSGLTTLQNLNLAGGRQFTDEGLQGLGCLENLEDLDLLGCHGITERGLMNLKDCAALRHLYTDVMDRSCLSHLTKLCIWP